MREVFTTSGKTAMRRPDKPAEQQPGLGNNRGLYHASSKPFRLRSPHRPQALAGKETWTNTPRENVWARVNVKFAKTRELPPPRLTSSMHGHADVSIPGAYEDIGVYFEAEILDALQSHLVVYPNSVTAN